MVHPHKKEAEAGHAKKLAGYGGKSKSFDDKSSFDGLKGLNNDEQAGLKIIDKEPKLSEETAPRIMRKRGGLVKGKEAVKRLDKSARKAKGRKKYEDGGLPTPYEAAESEERMGNIKREDTGSDSDNKSMPPASEAAKHSGTYQNYKKGGKVSHMEWEHSKADLKQDKKLAKKYGMSMEKWEKSALDKKHDKQQSTEGLKRGGAPKTKSYIPENPITKSARVGRASGGAAGKGKTTVNIIVGAGKGGQDQDMPIPAPGALPGRQPFQMPPQMPVGMPMAPPPMAGAPMAAPPMAPPPSLPPGGIGGAPMGGAGMPPGGPRPFKRGGRIRNVSDLDAGAGSGEGRLEKIELQNAKGWPPKGARKGFK